MDKLLRFGNHLFVKRSSLIYIRRRTIGLLRSRITVVAITDQQYSLERTIDYDTYLSVLQSLVGKDSSDFVRFGGEIIIKKDKIKYIHFDKNKKSAEIEFVDSPILTYLDDPVTYNDIVEYVMANSIHINQIFE